MKVDKDIISHQPIDGPGTLTLPNGATVLEIGRISYIGGLKFGVFDENSRIRIGNFCSIGEDVIFYLKTNHHPEWITTFPLEQLPWPAGRPLPADAHAGMKDHIHIGHDVWISHGARIMAGVTIGNGAVVSACSVVTKDVPPYTIVGGNPAREIRRRFSDADIATLEALRWWDLPLDQLRSIGPILCTGDIPALAAAIAALR